MTGRTALARPGQLGKAAVLLGAGLFAGLLVGELALRAAGFSYHLQPERVELGKPKALTALDNPYLSDLDLLWVRADYGAALKQARSEPPVFAFLGDSCTEYSRYPEHLLALLSQRQPQARWTGVNLGTAGWSTYQGLRQVQRDVLALHPRVMTIFYGWNDHWIGFGLEDADVARVHRFAGSTWERLRLVQLAERAYIGMRSQRQGENRRVPLPDFQRNLTEIVRLAKKQGSEAVLITAPSSHVRGQEPEYLRGRWLRDLDELIPLHQAYAAEVRRVAQTEGAVLCDLAQDFARLPPARRKASFLKDGIHFNARGAHRAAGFLYACLDREGVLRRAASG